MFVTLHSFDSIHEKKTPGSLHFEDKKVSLKSDFTQGRLNFVVLSLRSYETQQTILDDVDCVESESSHKSFRLFQGGTGMLSW